MSQTLTASDRCDRCGAQAYVVSIHEAGELLWCGHHFAEHQEALGEWVSDYRDRLVG